MRNAVPDGVAKVWTLLNREAPTYLVGGALRDLIRGVSPHDWDLATQLPPDVVEAIGKERGYRVVPTGKAYGTVTWWTDLGPLEVTTFRREGRYRDGRHPELVWFADTIEEDLSRRDFTMNAMALSVDGTLHDPFNGREDLNQGRIMTVGAPQARFNEDPLRMLRAVRFVGLAIKDQALTLDPGVFAAVQRLKGRILNVSPERQRDELVKLLAAPHYARALVALDETGMLGVIWPEWVATRNFWQQNPYHTRPVHHHLLETARLGPTPLLRLVGLLHDIAKPSCFWLDGDGVGHFYEHEQVGGVYARRMLERLAWDRATIDRVVLLISLHMFPWDDAGDRAIRRLLRKYGEEVVQQLLELRTMDIRGAGRTWDNESRVRQRVAHLQREYPIAKRTLQISGNHIMQWAHVKPGPEVGIWLERLRDWVDEDPSRNTEPRLKAKLLQSLTEDVDADRD